MAATAPATPPATQEQKPTAPTPAARGLRLRDPFDLFEEMQRELAHVFDRFPFAPRHPAPAGEPAPVGWAWAPRLDAYEKDGGLEITVDLPGMKRDEISIALDDGDLVISGERHSAKQVREADYYRMERQSGEFVRRVALPFEVKAEQIDARYADGVLTIHMPKPAEPESKATRIPVH